MYVIGVVVGVIGNIFWWVMNLSYCASVKISLEIVSGVISET